MVALWLNKLLGAESPETELHSADGQGQAHADGQLGQDWGQGNCQKVLPASKWSSVWVVCLQALSRFRHSGDMIQYAEAFMTDCLEQDLTWIFRVEDSIYQLDAKTNSKSILHHPMMTCPQAKLY